MITFTKEQLVASAHARIEFAEMMLAGELEPLKERTWSIELELARIALASLEAEPVAYVDPSAFNNFSVYRAGDTDNKRMGREWMWANPDAGLIPVYTAPPATVSVSDDEQCKPHPVMAVKGELGFLDHFDRIISERDEDIDICQLGCSNYEALMLAALDAFRAAMLQGADGNSQWVACSERMPEKGRTLALFGKRIKEVCANYVDEGYIGDDGEFYFFDWEGGPRIDDCHPYDKAIVTHWMYWELPSAPRQEVNP